MEIYSKYIGHIEASHILDFLSRMFDKGHAYSTINSAKCAIATIVYIPPYNLLNKHLLINKYMLGVFNLRPPKSKLSFDCMWIFFLGTLNNKVTIFIIRETTDT